MVNETYPWLESTLLNIGQQYQQGRLHHGLLIDANHGMGKLTLVKQLAQHLLCTAGQDRACGQCKSCHLFSQGNHPDYLLISDREANSVGVDAIRELVAKSQHKSQLGGNQVFVIDQSHKMTESAANALLKTLEEPNSQTYLLLTTTSVSHLLPTILSRCQIYKITAPTLQALQPWLQAKQVNIDDFAIAYQDMGQAPLCALELLADDYISQRQAFLNEFKQVLSGKICAMEFGVKAEETSLSFYYIWMMQALNKWLQVKSAQRQKAGFNHAQLYKIMDLYQAVLTSQKQNGLTGVNKKLNYQQLCHKIAQVNK
ncbi:DNA polymerase III subunit delta' [Saccharobesus litoralis]|uniref:DNA-directed DNA polymerase n=1 Tax=Saccharobesus litoralis TaxID=2172099 RepID=A0A2S0VP58_9ALTE|nr:DNA polymerase III subunit delta' [Saccharobesus litoralis]AWB65972.1 DNA polymerase III subunit delta' [Saccharobesus litoralis]